MKTLIIYASTDGQTKKIAAFIAEQLADQDIDITALDKASSFDIQHYQRVIIGASIRYGHFNRTLYQYVKQHVAYLNQIDSAFFAVNLTARKADKNTPETNAYTRKFLAKIPWQPKQSAVFAGALLYPRYHWFDRMMIRLIMKITGGETDTSKEVEYTDWQRVKQFADQFKPLN